MKKEKTNTKKTTKKKETVKKVKTPKPLYEGTVEYNLTTLREAIFSGKAFQRWSYLVLLTVTSIEQLYVIIHNLNNNVAITLYLPIVSIVICLYSIYNDFSKRDYERQLRHNDGKNVYQKVEFYEDKIVLTNLDFKTVAPFTYAEVNKMYETKNLLAIILKYNTGLTVEKKTLKKDVKELEEFIYKQKNLEPKKVKRVRIFSPYVFVGFLIINIFLLIISIIL